MTNAYNIYCDESSVDGDKKLRYMVIGALIIPRDKKVEFLTKLNSIKSKHRVGEIKWSNTSKASLELSKQIIDLFMKTDYSIFGAIVVDKSKINYEFYHEGSKELAFYKFYYILLKHKLQSGNKYYIYLDRKPVSVQNRVGVLKSFLTGFIKSFRQDAVIKHLQEYPSNQNALTQIADLFTGVVASKFNLGNQLKSAAKRSLIEHLEKTLKRDLSTSTSYFENKFNIFVWKPKNI